jgi:hypothetical protein
MVKFTSTLLLIAAYKFCIYCGTLTTRQYRLRLAINAVNGSHLFSYRSDREYKVNRIMDRKRTEEAVRSLLSSKKRPHSKIRESLGAYKNLVMSTN